MFSCLCKPDPVYIYIMATYKRVFLKLSDVPDNINPDILEFYEKDYYCLVLRRTTYEEYKNNCDGVLYTEKLHKNESIEQMNIQHIIIMDPKDQTEEKAYDFLVRHNMNYTYEGKLDVQFCKWIAEIDEFVELYK